MTKIYTCTLPFPPSVNGLFGGGSNQQRFKSKQYKAWLKKCPPLVLPECGAIDFAVTVRQVFYMPDKRKRDIGNYEKAVTDYLVSQCVLIDDHHEIVTEMHLKFGGVNRENPRVEIEVFTTR